MSVLISDIGTSRYHTDPDCVHVRDDYMEVELARLPGYAIECTDCWRDDLKARLIRASPDEV